MSSIHPTQTLTRTKLKLQSDEQGDGLGIHQQFVDKTKGAMVGYFTLSSGASSGRTPSGRTVLTRILASVRIGLYRA